MALTLRSVASASADNTSSAARVSFAMEAGKLYVALCSAAGSTTPGTESLTSASGNTWTSRKAQLGASSSAVSSVWTHAPSADGGDTLDYYNNGEFGGRGIWIVEISGDWKNDFATTWGDNDGTGTTHQVAVTPGTYSITVAAGFCKSDGTAEVANGSSVLIGNLQLPTVGAWNCFYVYGTGSSSYNLGTTETSASWCMAALEIKNELATIGQSEQVTPQDVLGFTIPVQTAFQPAYQQNAFQEYGGSAGADPLERSLSEQAAPTESTAGKAGQPSSLSEQAAPTETTQGYLRITAAVSEQAAPTESSQGYLRIRASLSEQPTATETVDGKSRQAVGLTEQPAPDDTYDYTWVGGDSLARDLAEQVAPADTYAAWASQVATVTEQAAPTETYARSEAGAEFSESVSPDESYAAKAAQAASQSESATPTDTFQGYLGIVRSLSESASPSDTVRGYLRINRDISESATPDDTVAGKSGQKDALSEQAFPDFDAKYPYTSNLSEQAFPDDTVAGSNPIVRHFTETANASDPLLAAAWKFAGGRYLKEQVSPGDSYHVGYSFRLQNRRQDNPAVTTTLVDTPQETVQNQRRALGLVIKKEE